jgi:hypothetical protein
MVNVLFTHSLARSGGITMAWVKLAAWKVFLSLVSEIRLTDSLSMEYISALPSRVRSPSHELLAD